MDYEKEYNELKTKFENLETTFNNYKEQTDKEKETLETNYNTLKNETDEQIQKLKDANVELFLQIPKNTDNQQNNQQPQEKEKEISCDDIVKNLGGM